MDREKFEKIWNDGCIILDTCTLDYISRCEFEYAKTIMDILLFCEKSVYVPEHVINEMRPYFEKNIIHTYIDGHIKNLEERINTVYKQETSDKIKKRKIIGYVQKTTNKLKKYSFGLYASELEKLSKYYSGKSIIKFPSLSECIIKAEQEVDLINKDSTVKRFLQMIMKNNLIGLSDEEKKILEIEYKERLVKGLPPGCGDKGKGVNSNGDLIIWKEILKNIKFSKMKYFLFITEDKKKDSNWYDKDSLNIHPALRKEVIDETGYDLVSVMDLYHYIQYCKPFVNVDIDVICKYLVEHNHIISEEIQKYFNENGQEVLMEEINDIIRSQYDGDWAIPYSYDISIIDLEYVVDKSSEIVKVTFNFQIDGDVEACYHYDGEDNMFDAEIYVNGSASAEIQIETGLYSNNLRLNYSNIDIFVDDEIYIEITDPLGRDEGDEENFQEDYDYDELEEIDDYYMDEEPYEYFDEYGI